MLLQRVFLAFAACLAAGSAALTPAAGVVVLDKDAVEASDELNDHCTTIIAGKGATVGGAPMTTHTNDCKDCDFRIFRVPGGDFPPGVLRPVYTERLQYPRLVAMERGDAYKPQPGQHVYKPRGYIPQVAHTYAYYDGVYGIMNERGVGIGEATCMSKIKVSDNSSALMLCQDAANLFDYYHGRSIRTSAFLCHTGASYTLQFDVGELTHVALERCDSARCAIKTMGHMAEKYGFYEPTGEGGEVLTVIDAEEAWVFAVMGTPDGTSATWAAARVPDDHVAAVANWFTIGEMDLDDPDNFLGSANLLSQAQELGYWNPQDGPFHFGRAYAPVHDAKTLHYTARRVWRVFSLLNPGNELNAFPKDDYEYPFSIKPAREVDARDLMAINRDHYEGSQFDMTTGLASGPFNTPNRQEFKVKDQYQGFARAISIHRTSFSTVIQSRPNVPEEVRGLLWLAPDAPHSSCYIPFYTGGAAVPQTFSVGSQWEWGMDKNVAWWVFNFLSNYMNTKYNIMRPIVAEKQNRLEEAFFAADREVIAQAQRHEGTFRLSMYLTGHTAKAAQLALDTWWDMLQSFIVQFNDGFNNTLKMEANGPKLNVVTIPYPDWYMDYVSGPAPHPSQPRNSGLRTWVPCVVSFLIGLIIASIFFVWRDKKEHKGYEPLN